jgi:short-subunit dehydrogenase
MGNSPTLLKFYKNEYKPGSCVLVHGASSGIGRELAKIYASRGCPMVVTGRNEKEL